MWEYVQIPGRGQIQFLLAEGWRQVRSDGGSWMRMCETCAFLQDNRRRGAIVSAAGLPCGCTHWRCTRQDGSLLWSRTTDAAGQETTPGSCQGNLEGKMTTSAMLLAAPDLAAYITAGVARIAGPQLPVRGEKQIYEAFIGRFGQEDAMRVAVAAVEVHGGPGHCPPVPAWQ